MEKYTIASVISENDNFVNIWTTDGHVFSLAVPAFCRHMVACDMQFRVLRSRVGHASVFCFGDEMILSGFPKNYKNIKAFLNGFQDIYHLSLDSIRFKYMLKKSLRQIGMTPTNSTRANLMLYKYCQDLVQGR